MGLVRVVGSVGVLLAVIISKMGNKIFYSVLVLVVLAVLVYVFGGSITGGIIGVSATDIKIPLNEISETAKFYEVGGVKFFAVRASDGSIKTAFDACDVCYGSKKGYQQEGDQMVCNNCGNKYPISGLGTENLRGGGCWPGYLPSKVERDGLIIKNSDLEKGRYRF